MHRLVALLALLGVCLAMFIGCGAQQQAKNDDDGTGGTGQVMCLAGQSLCNGICVTLSSNSANCGACGVACPAGTACANNACSCLPGTMSCDGACQIVTNNPSHCGGCNVRCALGELCTGNACSCQAGRMNCGTGCTDTQSDAMHCGACGTVCSGATPFCSMGICKASCDVGRTPCGTSCVDLTTDVANCGACANACTGAGQTCSGSMCTCPMGQLPCGAGGSCVDVTLDNAHCGACGNACQGGRTCQGGMCACPAGQELCGTACVPLGMCNTGGMGGMSGAGGAGATSGAGAGGTPGGAGGAGGAGGVGGGGAGGSGGGVVVPMPTTLACPNNVSIPAADVISDFRQTTPIMYQQGMPATRGGTVWYAYGAEDSGTTKGASTPGVGTNAFAVDAATPGPCNSGGSLHVSSNGNEGSTGWGFGFGVNLMGDVPMTNPPKKGQYNAQAAGYTGVGFYMKCQAEVDFIYLKIVDGPNDADIVNPVCSYSAAPQCNQFGIKNATATVDWTYHKLYFAEALQDWDSPTISSGNVNAAALTAFQIQVNTKYTRDGATRVRNPANCWVDDVHFIKDPPPRMHANVTPKTCMGGTPTSAPGGYYTMGNRIYDCKNAQPKIFQGMARPSLEWDRAGWNITYDDLARIRAWGANVVRFSVNQVFWQDTTSKGGLYKRVIDRAVKWSLALGMDVIIDLHWSGTSENDDGQRAMPTPAGVQFWTDMANAYENDGRVIFELYNEPYGVSPEVWKNGDGSNAGMQPMYNAVRAAGANNLVLVGGLDYAYRLDQVLPAQALSPGVNVAYVTHPYQFKAGDANAWNMAFGTLASTYPIFATEFGQANISQPGGTQGCNSGFYQSIIDYFDASPRFISWTAWAWHVERQITNVNDTCGFPQVITQYAGTTNPAGTVVKAELAAIP